METLYEEMKKKVVPLNDEKIDITFEYNQVTEKKSVLINITFEKEMKLSFHIYKEGEVFHSMFLASQYEWFDVYTRLLDKEALKQKKEKIFPYFARIEQTFQSWIENQQDIRLQYLMDPAGTVKEGFTWKYFKTLEKDLV